MDQLDAQAGAGPQQPGVHERAAVIDVDPVRDAAAGQRRAQRGGQPHGVLVDPNRAAITARDRSSMKQNR